MTLEMKHSENIDFSDTGVIYEGKQMKLSMDTDYSDK